MFHLDFYKWIRKTQVIPELGVDYNMCGDITWRVTDCEELVGILLGGVSDCEELVGVTWSVSVSVKN